jgi:hypothetical protein
MHLSEALENWHDFYVLVGTAGATLVALLFVAISLAIGVVTKESAERSQLFITPVVFHFSVVFFLAAISLIPTHKPAFFVVLIGGTGVVGFAVTSVVTVRLLKIWDDHTDHLAYGALPALSYAALLFAAVLLVMDSEWTLDVFAGAVLSLLMVNIRNAWDLAIAFVQRQSAEVRKRDPASGPPASS